MLDIGFHQGAGLHSFTPQSELRVLAVASQNNAASALETLWQICAHLQRLGLPVVVLDGTAQETEDSPGLLHLLLQMPGSHSAGLHAGAQAHSLAVIPAARGLHHLHQEVRSPQTPALSRLLPYFRSYGLVVLHAVAGIGEPERFFSMLREAGIGVVPHAFPDHHAYTPEDFSFGSQLHILMTEKDAVKCASFALPSAWVVPISAQLPESFWSALLSRLAHR